MLVSEPIETGHPIPGKEGASLVSGRHRRRSDRVVWPARSRAARGRFNRSTTLGHLQVRRDRKAIDRARASFLRVPGHQAQTETADELARLPRCAAADASGRGAVNVPTKPLRHGGVVSRTADDPCDVFEERAAIMQYEAGTSRADAERKAREDVRTYAQRERGGDGKAARSIRWVGRNRRHCSGACPRRALPVRVRRAER